MNAAIQFLARLGGDATLLDSKALATALADANVSAETMALIQANDVEGLKCLMPVRHDIVCAMVLGDDEPDNNEREEHITNVFKKVVSA